MFDVKKKIGIVTVLLILLTGCYQGGSITFEETVKTNMNQLSRVDVQKNHDTVMITDKITVDMLRKTFTQIEWKQDAKIDMPGSPDVKATLFFDWDENMPERLFEYSIWFNSGGLATIIVKDENTYGTLDQDSAQTLSDLLLNKIEMALLQRIEQDLATIINQNKVSSNPNDYISNHIDEFDNMVSKEQVTLNYFLNKFKTSDENGLREYILASVCVEILGEKNSIQQWSSGREWYEKYTASQVPIEVEFKSFEEQQVQLETYTYEDYKGLFDIVVAETKEYEVEGEVLRKWLIRTLVNVELFYETDLTKDEIMGLAKQQMEENETWKQFVYEHYKITITEEEVKTFIQEGPMASLKPDSDDLSEGNKGMIQAFVDSFNLTIEEYNYQFERDIHERNVIWGKLQPLLTEKYGTTSSLHEKYNKEVEGSLKD